MRQHKRIEYEGRRYVVLGSVHEVPDLSALDRLAALIWLNRNTFPQGRVKDNPLAGLGSAISIEAAGE